MLEQWCSINFYHPSLTCLQTNRLKYLPFKVKLPLFILSLSNQTGKKLYVSIHSFLRFETYKRMYKVYFASLNRTTNHNEVKTSMKQSLRVQQLQHVYFHSFKIINFCQNHLGKKSFGCKGQRPHIWCLVVKGRW